MNFSSLDTGSILIIVSVVFTAIMFGLRTTQENSANLTLYYIFNVLMYIGIIAVFYFIVTTMGGKYL